MRALADQPRFRSRMLSHFAPGVEPALVTFQLDANGQVDRITMRPVAPLADFSFDYHDLEFRPVREGARGG